jgi:hypothetical protein
MKLKCLVFLVSVSTLTLASNLHASNRGVFSLSGGYAHNLMYTSDNSSSGGDDANVNFGKGYGLYISPSWQSEGRFGIILPLRFNAHSLSRSRIVGSENIYYLGGGAMASVRFFREALRGWDPYFAMGLGLNYVTEGGRSDNSSSFGPSLNLEVGVDYHFNDSWAIHLGIPFQAILFFGDNLTDDGTGVSAIPFSLGATFKF